MRNLLVFILFAIPINALSEEYFLEIEKVCFSYGDKLEFTCETKKDERKLIFSENGKWYGRNPDNAQELSVIKNDEYILVLENPVYFSGTDRIHLIKATGKFYWSVFAYSGSLG